MVNCSHQCGAGGRKTVLTINIALRAGANLRVFALPPSSKTSLVRQVERSELQRDVVERLLQLHSASHVVELDGVRGRGRCSRALAQSIDGGLVVSEPWNPTV